MLMGALGHKLSLKHTLFTGQVFGETANTPRGMPTSHYQSAWVPASIAPLSSAPR